MHPANHAVLHMGEYYFLTPVVISPEACGFLLQSLAQMFLLVTKLPSTGFAKTLNSFPLFYTEAVSLVPCYSTVPAAPAPPAHSAASPRPSPGLSHSTQHVDGLGCDSIAGQLHVGQRFA